MATSNTLIHLLDTNTIPSNVEAASIEQSIAKYDVEIAKLQSQLNALVEQRRRHHAVLSPLRRMPLELLGEIFTMVPPYILDHSGRQDVINLGLVCKRWRDATIYTHRLWSSVAIVPRNGLEAYDKTVSWLQKSGSVPKSLRFDAHWAHCGCSEEGEGPCLATNPALVRLLTEGPVLDHFELVVSSIRCFKNWVAAINAVEKIPTRPCPWDALRSFDLTFNDHNDERWTELEHDNFEQWCFSLLPPTITALHLYLPAAWAGFGEDDESLSRHGALKIPVEVLNRLTTFTIRCDWSGTKLVELLQHCTNVETLTIESNHRSRLLEERGDPLLYALAKSRIHLPKVRSLRLKEAGTAEILRYLNTPAITNLDLGFGWESEDTDFISIVPKFLQASNATSSLLSFRLYDLHISGYDLRQSLNGLDSLKRLTLDKVTWSGDLFIAVRNSDHKCKPRIPSLEQLEILQFSDNRGVLPIGSGALMEGIRQGCMPCTLTMSLRGGHSMTRPFSFFIEENRRTWRDKAFMYVQTVPPFDWECLQV